MQTTVGVVIGGLDLNQGPPHCNVMLNRINTTEDEQ